MVPADFKEWWLAAIAVAASTTQAPAQQPPEQAGVVSGQQGVSKSLGSPGMPGERVLYMGEKTYRFERVRSEANSTTHIMFLDQSSVTLGPDSELVLDEFVYSPQSRSGSIKMNLVRGLVRVVGGEISKTNETVITTAVGTAGIRGGITIIEHRNNRMRGVFLFGQSMRMSTPNGDSQTITRQGFGVTVDGNQLSQPRHFPSSELSTLISTLETPPTGTDTARQPSGAPPGQLISTSDRPSGSGGISTLSPERLPTQVDLQGPAETRTIVPGQLITDNTVRNTLTPTTRSPS